MTCRICDTDCEHCFTHTILNRYVCEYFLCSACGFLQTEAPYWLDEAYSSAITTADTGLVYRNVRLSKIVSSLLYFCFPRDGKYLDMAGGYGLLTRLMRDIGFDFYWSDLYCANLVARGFESNERTGPFQAVTAFEVMEHLPDPLTFLKEAMQTSGCRTLLFSTELYAGPPPAPDDWWYYTFPTGQHIAFYQLRTLQVLAEKLGLQCHSNGSFHVLTDQKIHPLSFRLLTSPRVCTLLAPFLRKTMQSRTVADMQGILANHQ